MGVYLFVLPLPQVISIREASFFLAIVIVVVSRLRGGGWEWPPLKTLLLLWVALPLVSLVASDDIWLSLSEIKKEILYPILAFWLFYTVARGKRDFAFLALFILASATLSIMASLYTYYYLGLGFGDLTVSGYLYGSSAYYGFFMLSTAAVGVAVAMSKDAGKVLRGFVLGLMPLCALGVYMAKLRAGYLAIAVAACVFLIYTNVVKKSLTRKIVVLACMLLIVLSIPQIIAKKSLNPATSSGNFSASLVALANEERFVIWKKSIEEIFERPILGKGFGNKEILVDARDRSIFYSKIYPHNIFLSYGIMTGVGGAALLLVIFARLFLLLHHKTMRSIGVDRTYFGISLSGILLLVVFVVLNLMVDLMTRHTGQLFWALMGMTLGSCRIEGTKNADGSLRVRVLPHDEGVDNNYSQGSQGD